MFKRHLLSVALALSTGVIASLPAKAYLRAGIPERGFLPQTTYMAERGRVSAPFGHIEFCVHSPSECVSRSRGSKKASLSRAKWRMLKRVNSRVNRSMRSKSDRAVHGRSDHWSIGGRVGDCEDYALTKRHQLIARGWSSNTVLVATVRDRRNRMHAVLVVHTNRGDFVLDNLTRHIRPWNKTGYKWLKRQSRHNPKRWVGLSNRAAITATIPLKSRAKLSKKHKRNLAALAAPMAKTGKVSRRAKAKVSIALPPLPRRNTAKQYNTRITRLLARLADVQKRLVVKKPGRHVTLLLARLEKVQKRLRVKKAMKLKLARRSIKKSVRKARVARKTAKKRRISKTIVRQRSASKALAVLKKIRKTRRKRVHHKRAARARARLQRQSS